ncbi:MAG: Aquaporin 2 [Bacteroidota bacterium]
MKIFIPELIGSFLLTLCFSLSVGYSEVLRITPLAYGSMMMALMYMTGRSSGFFNPGITLAAAMCGRAERNDAITGITAQVFGTLVAAALAAFMRESGGETVVAMHGNNNPFGALLAEFFGSFALIYVFLGATSGENRSFAGLAAGFCLIACGFGPGALGGGVFNPAVALGAGLTEVLDLNDLWVYLAGDFGGAAAGATVFTLMNREMAQHR